MAGGSAEREIVALKAEGVPRKGESLAGIGFMEDSTIKKMFLCSYPKVMMVSFIADVQCLLSFPDVLSPSKLHVGR